VSSCLPIVAQQIKVMAVDRYRAGCEQGPDVKINALRADLPPHCH
jgi:hypothetical protein